MLRTSTRPFLLLCALLLTASTAQADLGRDVARAITASGLRDASIAVSVRECESDELLVSIKGERPMIPASNMKVLTTGAALHVLGPEFLFRTRLVHDGERLWVIGDGDPAFGDPVLLEQMSYTDGKGNVRDGLDAEMLIGLWVRAVDAAEITGTTEVVVDDRIFARELVHPSWPREQLNARSFAQVAGLNFHANLLDFYPRKRSGDRPDVSRFSPNAPWIRVINKATSKTSKGDKQTVWFTRPPDSNDYTVFGNVKFDARDPVQVTVHDMPNFFSRLLSDRLRQSGINAGEGRIAAPDDPDPVGRVIGPIVQTPLTTVVSRCNTDSQNLYAESLLKRTGFALTGQPGSWANGGGAIRHVVYERIGDRLGAALVVGDGSGLSRRNRVTADLLTAWLDSFHRDATARAEADASPEAIERVRLRNALGDAFLNSLAVGGRTGTVRSRFRDLDGAVVQCKTGYINGVSCLSGYVTTSDGRRRSFSVLCNELVQSNAVRKAKKLQEAIVTLVAEDMMIGASREALGGN